MKKGICFLLVLTFFSAVVLAGSASRATATADFYKGKTIVIVVTYSPGGSFDMLARLVAGILPKYTGGRVAVRNIPGGGGILGYNYMARAKPDGLIMAITHGPKMITSDLFNLKGVKYKASQFTYLGNLFTANNMLAIAKDSPLKRLQDVRDLKGTFRIAATKPFYEPHWAEVFGLKNAKVIPGYGGFGEKVAAVARGEVQACVGAIVGAVAHKDTIKMLAVTFKDPNYPQVPSAREGALPGKKKWVEYLEMWPGVMRMMIAPPGVPPDRAKFLEEALGKVYTDKKFIKEAVRLQAEIRPQFATGKDMKRSVDKVAKLSDKEIKELKHLVEKKYLPQ